MLYSEINFKPWQEEISDDNDYEMRGQALPIAPFDMNKVNKSNIPLTSQEYLQQVIAERARLPGVVTASVPKLKIDNSQKSNICFFPDEKIVPFEYKPSEKWQQEQIFNFSNLRYRIDCNKQIWAKTNTKCFPLKKNDWFIFLFQDNLSENKSQQPYLNIVLSMHNEMIELVIKFITEWVIEDKLSVFYAGTWLFALLACIEVPVCIKLMKKLRIFTLKCREIRQNIDFSVEENKKELIAQNLFICLIGKYFGQHDLSD